MTAINLFVWFTWVGIASAVACYAARVISARPLAPGAAVLKRVIVVSHGAVGLALLFGDVQIFGPPSEAPALSTMAAFNGVAVVLWLLALRPISTEVGVSLEVFGPLRGAGRRRWPPASSKSPFSCDHVGPVPFGVVENNNARLAHLLVSTWPVTAMCVFFLLWVSLFASGTLGGWGCGIGVWAPAMPTAGAIASDPNGISLFIQDSGHMFLNGDWVPEGKLKSAVRGALAAQSDAAVFVLADRRVQFSRVQAVLIALRDLPTARIYLTNGQKWSALRAEAARGGRLRAAP